MGCPVAEEDGVEEEGAGMAEDGAMVHRRSALRVCLAGPNSEMCICRMVSGMDDGGRLRKC